MAVEPLPSETQIDSPPTPLSTGYARSGRVRPRRAEIHLEEPSKFKLHENAKVWLGLQRQAVYNLRRHVQRAVTRFAALLIADLAAFWLMRELIRSVRDESAFGPQVASFLRDVVPTGYLNGWQYGAALVLGLVVLRNYGMGDSRRDPTRIFLACALATALPLWMLLWTRGLEPVVVQYGVTTFLMWAGIVAERAIVDHLIRGVRRPRRNAADVVFVGPGRDCQAAASGPAFQQNQDHRPIGFVDVNDPPAAGALGTLAQFPLLLAGSGAEAVVICGHLSDVEFHDVVEAALAADCQVFSVPRTIKIAGVDPTVVWKNGQPLIELNKPVVRAPALFAKRLVDLLVGTGGLLLLSPLFVLLAIWVKLDSRGPVFFGSERWGQRGRRIRIWKFRTMIDGASRLIEEDATLRSAYEKEVKLRADPRLTRLGRWLRRWSLDELPQLFNVVTGDMSLVGPRPKLFGEESRYGALFGSVLGVPPGITGLWQVSGRGALSYDERIALDLDYVRRCSLLLDARILLRTMPVVLGGRGAH